jgi:arylsulfatase A
MKPWLILVFVATASVAHPLVASAAQRPNIIFIVADDLGLPGVGCYGGAYRTPALDALAADGTRFERCFAAPLCGPTRALLLTGRYAFRTGVTENNRGPLATPDKDGCVALQMKQAGYATAVAGKWHQLRHFTTRADGARWGFDEFLLWGPAEEDEEGRSKAEQRLAREKGRPDRYWGPIFNHNGEALTGTPDQYGPDVLNEWVIEFIRRHKDGPFFVYYPMPLLHGPLARTPDSPADRAVPAKKKQAFENSNADSLYADSIAYVDTLVGRLVAALDDVQVRENTLLVFCGDNGSVPVGTLHGRMVDGSKGQLTDGGSRVPLIVHWPRGTPAGAIRHDLVDASDFLPTFAELAGARLPDRIRIDGRSFAPAIRGEKGTPRDWVYVQLGSERYVRSDRWKLTDADEWFDMHDAPFRQILVPADARDPDVTAAWQALREVLAGLSAEEAAAPAPKKRKKPST